MTWTALALAAFAAWLVFNWLAPLSLTFFGLPLSTGRLPGEILYMANAHRVRYYTAKLRGGYAFSTWLGFSHAVFLSEDFMRSAPPAVVRFVLAHELGHCALGHLRWRWLCVVSGAILLPAVRRWLRRQEEDADAWAEALSGVPRSVIRGART